VSLTADLSEIGVANRALDLLGQEPVAAFDQTHRKAARLLGRHFAPTRRALIRTYRWNFAHARGEASVSGAAPAFGYAAAFTLPADCLRVLEVDGLPDEEWEVEEERKLTCNLAGPIKFSFNRDIADPARWDALFHRLFEYELAIALAGGLQVGEDIEKKLEGGAARVRSRATPIDAQEARRHEERPYSWIAARFAV
jgi:hypothetical protein